MAPATLSFSHFAPLTALYFLLLFFSCPLPILAVNVTDLISHHSSLTGFADSLAATSVAADLLSRSSITVLAVPNAFLRHAAANISDAVLRYHVLLQYISWDDLPAIPAEGKLVTTLFQTTGRAPGKLRVRQPSPGIRPQNSPPSTYRAPTPPIVSEIADVPYNISIFSVNSLLVPYGIDLMASDTRPSPGVSITKALIDGHDFNVAASMLAASGVEQEFEDKEGGAGLTLFMPTDEAFSDLPNSLGFQSLPADKKAAILRFHVLHSYYPLGTLEKVVNPTEPTLETEQNWAGSFTLNISKINGSLTIGTGNVQASVTQTVYDQNPVAIFGISHVLLPVEFFGRNRIEVNRSGGGSVDGTPEITLSPGTDGASGLSSAPPPGFHQDGASSAAKGIVRTFLIVWCVGFYLLVCCNY
uniref:Fasciclin-like arabinogalactan protein 10 n=1 Tax=Cuscuta campestris TaxID=132261 RepID=A0A2Z5U8I4_9ASTE|nr:fasciclin-like arabinogalactan protein 10 [Cuscuta campestris]